MNTIKFSSRVKKTFKFSLVVRTRENTDVFISLGDNIYGIHSKRVDILCLASEMKMAYFYAKTPLYSHQTMFVSDVHYCFAVLHDLK